MKTRIYIIKLNSIISYFAILVAFTTVLSLLGITGMKAVEVFASVRSIPIYSVDYTEKKASITFDCAWGSDDIPDILNTLERENIKATFFIVGEWAQKFPQMVKLIAEKGHDVANHSHTHLRMGVLDEERIYKEIVQCNNKLEEISGKKVELFRPPYGDYNDLVVKTAGKAGCYTIQWNVDSLDWKPGISKEEIMNRITKRIQPGSIILFHNDTPHTAKLLPTIITDLKKNGYSFLPVSELIMRENYYIDHEGVQKRKK
ncbi:MAG TPA: polysaccharide deacetylase family protein [Clostridiales bacterium]|nr:polysaccharide deacetylase family protein [Clostridiales bacterium]